MLTPLSGLSAYTLHQQQPGQPDLVPHDPCLSNTRLLDRAVNFHSDNIWKDFSVSPPEKKDIFIYEYVMVEVNCNYVHGFTKQIMLADM